MADCQNARRNWPLRGSGPVLLTLGGLAAAFGVTSCCALPLALASLGMGTAWLGGVALLAAPHRPFLFAAAALCLLGAVLPLWQQSRATTCGTNRLCAHPAVRRITMMGVLLGFAMLYLGYTYV